MRLMFIGQLRSINDHWLSADRKVTRPQWENTRLLALALLLAGPHIPRLVAVANVPESLIDSSLRFPGGALATAPTYLLVALAAVLVLAASMGLSGIGVKGFGVATAILLLVGNSVLYSVEGKIVHHQWTSFAIAVMSWTLWSGRSTFSERWSPRFVLAWVLAWGLSTSALVKVRGGWLDPGFSAVRAEVEFQSIRQNDLTALSRFLREALGESFFWEIADYGTIALELTLLIAILRPSWFRIAIVALTMFHLSILLALGISFVGILPAYVPFVAEAMPTRTPQRKAVRVTAVVLGAMAMTAVLLSVPELTALVLTPLGVPKLVVDGGTLLIIPMFVVCQAILHRVARRDHIAHETNN